MRYQHSLYITEKYIYWATIPSLTIWSTIIRLAVVAPKCVKSREILRKFELIAGQDHPRS